MFEKVTVEIRTGKPVSVAWRVFTDPDFITKWYFASEDWHCPAARNDLREDGEFSFRMESKDKKYGFDFSGKYLKVIERKKITYELGDGRTVRIEFIEGDRGLTVRETFDAETENSLERQMTGWQAILDNFKAVLEAE